MLHGDVSHVLEFLGFSWGFAGGAGGSGVCFSLSPSLRSSLAPNTGRTPGGSPTRIGISDLLGKGRSPLRKTAPRWACRSNWQLSCYSLRAAIQRLPAVDTCICSTDRRHETILDFGAESTEQPDQPADPEIYQQPAGLLAG